jgi:hypothetical protein
LIKNPKTKGLKLTNVGLEGKKEKKKKKKKKSHINKVKLMSHIKNILFSPFSISQVLCICG